MRKDIVEELFKKYYNNALLYSLSLTKDKAQAEDIVATAFFKALRTADGKIGNFKPWLIKVCRNTYLDSVVDHRRKRELTEDIIDESEQAVDKIIRDERHQALYRAISLLPVPQREVVLLFYFEDLSVKQIAEAVNKTLDNVKVLLYRARENMRKILEDNQR